MRDINGRDLRSPKLFEGQKTLFNFDKVPPNFYYGNINLDHPDGRYRWRDIGSADNERMILQGLRESLSHYYPSGGFVLREDPSDMTIDTARRYSIGMMIRHMYDEDERGPCMQYFNNPPKFIYVYYERRKYRGRNSVPYVVYRNGVTKICSKMDYDPYK